MRRHKVLYILFLLVVVCSGYPSIFYISPLGPNCLSLVDSEGTGIPPRFVRPWNRSSTDDTSSGDARFQKHPWPLTYTIISIGGLLCLSMGTWRGLPSTRKWLGMARAHDTFPGSRCVCLARLQNHTLFNSFGCASRSPRVDDLGACL